MKKLTNKKKVIIAVTTLAVFLLAGIVSIVLVLSANRQQISSNVSVSYLVSGVGAKVSANYAVVPNNLNETITVNQMSDRNDANKKDQSFGVGENESTKDLTPNGDIGLDTTHQQVVFEYKFENLAESAFYIELGQSPITGEDTRNMKEYYFVTKNRLNPVQYLARITEEIPAGGMQKQAIVDNEPVYIYIMAQVDNENRSAQYEGQFVWVLNYAETINITIDGTSAKIIPTSKVDGIAMPVFDASSVTAPEGKAFNGLYTASTGGTQYTKANGMSAHDADLAEGTALYAQFDDIMQVTSGMFSLTEAGKAGFAGALTIPSTATSIEDNACAGSNITELTIPNEVETIGNSAFEGCTSLATVTIGTASNASAESDVQLSRIGTNAFAGCTALEAVEYNGEVVDWNAISFNNIPGKFTLLGAKYIVETTWTGDDYKYSHPLFGTEVQPTVSLTEIDSIDINFSLDVSSKTMPAGTLSNCGKLSGNIELPYGILTLDTLCFANFNMMEYLSGESLECYSELTSIIIPDSVNTINAGSFALCLECESAYIGKNVATIDTMAFYNCLGIETISFAQTSNLTSIGEGAFNDCSSLTSIEIPSSVISIGLEAFRGCSKLTSIEIPNRVTSIGKASFMDCYSLTSVTFDENSQITIIEGDIFSQCFSLISIEIPSSVISIESTAFSNCIRLSSITFVETSGWKISDDKEHTINVQSIDVSDAETNVENFGEPWVSKSKYLFREV